jgi:polyisoprenyl-phosphate glycosyltransferase
MPRIPHETSTAGPEPPLRPKRDCLVSVVAPLWNDAGIARDFVQETISILEQTYQYFELVLVDDGSSDETVEVVQELLVTTPGVRLVRLSRHFGDEIAIYAGLETVIGDYIVSLLPATDPPPLIPQLVDPLLTHGGVVVGVRSRHEGSLTARLGSTFFYWVCNKFLGLPVPKGSTHFRALSRKALNAMLRIKDSNRYMKVFSTYTGYHHQAVVYDQIRRKGGGPPRERGLLRSIDLAVNVMVANSTRLLRFVTGLGVVAGGLNLLYMGYILAIAIFKENVAEGWITLSAQNAGMFFFLFLILTVLGEYIGRILAETQNRPLYYITEERNSSVLVVDPDQKNVIVERPNGG